MKFYQRNPQNYFIVDSKIDSYDVIVAFDIESEDPGYFVNFSHMCNKIGHGDWTVNSVLEIGQDLFVQLIEVHTDITLPNIKQLTVDMLYSLGLFFEINDSECVRDNGIYGPRWFAEVFLIIIDPVFERKAVNYIKNQIKKFNNY